MWHELTTQVPRPVWPLIRPAAIPGKAAPWVPETQEPAEDRAEDYGAHGRHIHTRWLPVAGAAPT